MTPQKNSLRSDIGRFAIVPEWLLDCTVTAQAVRLFAVLHAKYADKSTLEAFPSRRRLAQDVGPSTDTVDRAVKELEQVGALLKTARLGADGQPTSSLYELRLARPDAVSLVQGGMGSGAATPVGAPAATGSRRDAAQNQNHVLTQNHSTQREDVDSLLDLWVTERERCGFATWTDARALGWLRKALCEVVEDAGVESVDLKRAIFKYASTHYADTREAARWVRDCAAARHDVVARAKRTQERAAKEAEHDRMVEEELCELERLNPGKSRKQLIDERMLNALTQTSAA